jgi:extradiol dioxygenase family protein
LDDWQALRERLNSGNVEIFKDRTVNFGARGDGISMYFRDPEGNEIEARYYEG